MTELVSPTYGPVRSCVSVEITVQMLDPAELAKHLREKEVLWYSTPEQLPFVEPGIRLSAVALPSGKELWIEAYKDIWSFYYHDEYPEEALQRIVDEMSSYLGTHLVIDRHGIDV